MLDAAFQALAFLHGLDSDMFVPNGIAQVFLLRPAGSIAEAAAHAVLRSESRDVVTGDVDVYDATSGEVVLMVRGLALRRAPSAKSKAPGLYATTLQHMAFCCPDTPVPQDLDDLVPILKEQLKIGRIVRVLGLPGSNEPMLKIAKSLALTDKQASLCPLRNSQLLMVSLDGTVENPIQVPSLCFIYRLFLGAGEVKLCRKWPFPIVAFLQLKANILSVGLSGSSMTLWQPLCFSFAQPPKDVPPLHMLGLSPGPNESRNVPGGHLPVPFTGLMTPVPSSREHGTFWCVAMMGTCMVSGMMQAMQSFGHYLTPRGEGVSQMPKVPEQAVFESSQCSSGNLSGLSPSPRRL